MPVAVMDIREMGVLVLERFVVVDVRVGFLALPASAVRVAMMLVMHVAVLVTQRLVPVPV